MMKSRSIAGFALPSAIFLLVILSALGAFILNVSSSQQQGMALDIRGERAWQAPNAGMEWVRYRLAATPAAPACPANTTWGASTYSIGFAGSATLTDFLATVECRQIDSTNVDGVATWVFEVRVTACSPAAGVVLRCPGVPTVAGYAERQLQGLVAF
jgi:MSHA biogenesis protein MshP